MTARRRAGLTVLGLLLGALAVPVFAGAAVAHDALAEAEPGADATVSSASEIALTFTADPVGGEGASIVQVEGPDGRYYETACPVIAGPLVRTPVALGPAGTYEVRWRIVSSDGHPVSSSYAFDYAPGADAAAPAAGAAAPQCAPPAETAGATVPAGTSTDAGLWIGIGVGAVVAVGAAAGAWALLRRPRPRG